MSRAVELAKECGAQESMYLVALGDGMYAMKMTPEQLEAFYHAARAEALREAAEHCHEYAIGLANASHHDWPTAVVAACDLVEELRAMAEREGK